jgi:hypothetical protein
MNLGDASRASSAALMPLSCGARSSLSIDGDTEAVGGSGGGSGITASSSTSSAGGGAPACLSEDLSTWPVERYRDDGDYERAAVATRGVPWVALKVRDGNIVLERLGIDAGTGIAVLESFELPNSPVYPVGLDVSDTRFVLLTTTGINWNGDVELWSVERSSGAVIRVPVGSPPADPAYTVGSALGLVGDDVVLAYSRLIENQGTLELRDGTLQVVQSLALDGTSFTAVHRSESALDVYVGAAGRLHVEGGAITEEPVDPSWQVMGGLEEALVQYGDQIRLTQSGQTWDGPWPHTQISPPAVVRSHGGRSVFSLETELTAVVGYPLGDKLEWMEIEPAQGASGTGVALMPLLEDGRMGVFYLGLEIPQPEQPLRYFGRACR